MAIGLEREEAEAIFLLKGAHAGAWNVLLMMFARKHSFEADKCVDTSKETVEVHQGMARVFRDLADIEEEAERLRKA